MVIVLTVRREGEVWVALMSKKLNTYEENIELSSYATRAKKIKYKVDDNNCWICVSHPLDKDGYPKIIRNKNHWRMNRYIYTLEKGEIKDGKIIMHICDNPRCINPEHLKEGTWKENMIDRDQKKRNAYGEKNGEAKLSKEDVMKIRNDNREVREIAKDYPVHFSQIARIKRREAWSHISSTG